MVTYLLANTMQALLVIAQYREYTHLFDSFNHGVLIMNFEGKYISGFIVNISDCELNN